MNYPINSIKIERFRGFENFSIEKFSRINIFVGMNNVGKTSLLEAVFLLTGMSNPTLPSLVNSIREDGGAKTENLTWLFYQGNIHTPIVISDAGARAIHIEPKLRLDDGRGTTPIYSTSGLKIEGLKNIFSKEGTEDNVTFIEKEGDVTFSRSNYTEKILACFLPSSEIKANLLANLEAIVLGNKKGRLIDIIKQFDGNVLGVEIINKQVYVHLSNVETLVPISFIGDGLLRFIGICSAVLAPGNKVVLIDEIDNGLHYTVFKLLWKSLIALSIENDTQLFITTHSEESLRLLTKVLEEGDGTGIDLSVFSIQKTKKAGLQAYQYPPEALRGAMEKEIEIR
ncbi:MAG: AAA family ATPase [Bacteroides sp.]